jgi:hypothetical protein
VWCGVVRDRVCGGECLYVMCLCVVCLCVVCLCVVWCGGGVWVLSLTNFLLLVSPTVTSPPTRLKPISPTMGMWHCFRCS